jgi:carbon-monoxide dehydrogenase large subunit
VQCATEKQQTMVGNHTGGSRSTVGAAVCHLAALKVIDEGKAAAPRAGRRASQVSYAKGVFESTDAKRLSSSTCQSGPLRSWPMTRPTYPNGCHIVEVEIDPRPARRKSRHSAVDDGVVINHTVVEARSMAAAMDRQVPGNTSRRPRDGPALTGRFMDCHAARGVLPASRETGTDSSKVSLLGVKGVGESGCTGSIPRGHAVMDALTRWSKPYRHAAHAVEGVARVAVREEELNRRPQRFKITADDADRRGEIKEKRTLWPELAGTSFGEAADFRYNLEAKLLSAG